MFEVKKTLVVSISHRLNLPYESKCQRLHGHDFKITVHCRSEKLDDNCMVVDFTDIKRQIDSELDHRDLNTTPIPQGEKINEQPTAENVAYWVCGQINSFLVTRNPRALCYRVDVQESEGNIATYFVEE